LMDEKEDDQKSRIISTSFFVIGSGCLCTFVVSTIAYAFSHNIILFLGGVYVMCTAMNSFCMHYGTLMFLG